MYLSNIELTNYRPYYHTVNIPFGYSEEKNCNVIFANNAIGKSSLLNAITWAFYGEELHDKKKRENPIYNKIAKNECDVGDEFRASVKLYLYDFNASNEKIHFHVERTRIYEIDEEKNAILQEETLKILDFDGEIYENDQLKIYTNISRLMHKYFFFNGEQLGDYFDNNDLKESIDRISQLNLIDKVEEHLRNVRNNKILPEISELDSDVRPVNDKIRNLLQEIDVLEKEKKDLTGLISELNRQLQQTLIKLGALEKSKELSQERDRLKDEKETLLKLLKEKEKTYNEGVIELYTIVHLFDFLESVSKIDVKNPEINQLKNEILMELYEGILHEGVCICGSNFNNQPRCKNMIQSKLDTIKLSSNDDLVPTEENKIKSKAIEEIRILLKSIKSKHEQINSLRKDIVDANERLNGNEGINKRLKEISAEFTEGGDTQLETLERNRIDLDEKIDEQEEILEGIKAEIIKKNGEKVDLENERDIIISNNAQLEQVKKQLKFCEDAIEIVGDLDKNLNEDILRQLRERIYSQFIGTEWSDDKFTNITIDDDFNILMKDFLSDDIIHGDLSGGEERILVLSFIIALNSISGFDLPLFIDAPLTNLDDESSSYFLTNLNKFTKDKQIIFLFIEDRYDEKTENMIKPYLNKKIELIKKQKYITEVEVHG